MSDLIQAVNSPEEIARTAARLRAVAFEKALSIRTVLELFERWAAALQGRGMETLPGAAFLRLWLRRGTIEPILERELGRNSLNGGWQSDGRAKLKVFPLGTVGHWPAGNIQIQPVLSMTCALLGGNGCLVRVPTGLVEATRQLMEKLQAVDQAGVLTERIELVSFEHSRDDLQTAMAQNVDAP